VVTLPSIFTGKPADIPVGTRVYGPGIPAGATVTALKSSPTTGRVTEVTLSAKPLAAAVSGGIGGGRVFVPAGSAWFRDIRPGQNVQFLNASGAVLQVRNASGAIVGSQAAVSAVDPVVGTVTLAGGAIVPAGALEIGIAGTRAATIGFGVRDAAGNPQTVGVPAADLGKLFIGQDVHGTGLPEYSQLAGLRLEGVGDDYLLLSAPSTSLSAAASTFAALADRVVFAERSASSNRIYGNGEYGIVVRHQDTGPLARGANGLPTRIFANYFGLAGESAEVTPNRIAPIWYTYEYTPQARTAAIMPGQSIVVPGADWSSSAEVDQPVQFLNASNQLLGKARVTAIAGGSVTLSAPAPAGTTQVRKAMRLPGRHDVTGRVSRVDLLGNKFGLGTTVLPPPSPINPVPPGDPII
jgi:hypothetical protein